MGEEFDVFHYGTRVMVRGFHPKGHFPAIVCESRAVANGHGDEIALSQYRVLEIEDMPPGEVDHGDMGVEFHRWVPSQLMEPIDYDLEHNQNIVRAYTLTATA